MKKIKMIGHNMILNYLTFKERFEYTIGEPKSIAKYLIIFDPEVSTYYLIDGISGDALRTTSSLNELINFVHSQSPGLVALHNIKSNEVSDYKPDFVYFFVDEGKFVNLDLAGSIKALPVYQGNDSITKDLAFAVGSRFENVLARRNIVSVEYYEETTGQWVPWDVDVTPLFDDEISWAWLTVNYTHRKFRITVHAGSYVPYSHFLFVWGDSSGINGHTITIETSSDLTTWVNEGTLSGRDCYYTQEIFAKFDSAAVYTSTRPYLRFTFDIDMNDTGYAKLIEILGFTFRVVFLGPDHKPFIAFYDKSVMFRNTIFPEEDNAYNLGMGTNRWRNVYFAGTLRGGVGNLSSLQIGGTEVLTSSRVLQNIASISQNWLPASDNTYDLGSSTLRWRNLYAVNVNTGDVLFQNDWKITEYDESGQLMDGLRILNKNGEEIFKITEEGLYFKGKKIA